MKKKLKQLLALVLTLAVVMGFALPAAAADPGPRVTIEKVSNDAVTAEPEMHTAETKEDTPQYADTDMVRVSITLAGASTIDAGYATRSIANNAAADIYRTGLKVQQQAMAQRISQDVLGGEALDVVWNMTLLTNTISANVPYGKIEAIEALDGVASVTLENRYEPDVVSTGDADPDMATSGAMIGSTAAWADGYTGAGSRIAVIDTGTDTDHISFDGKAFEYSLEQLAADAGKSKDEFVASLDLLDVDEIAAVLPKLNISKLVPDASKLYLTSKLPFAFNYVDENFDITHDNDKQGEHGSHVAGIAAAAAFAQTGDLNRPAVFDMAAQIEGHPDNVAPAVFGGLTVSWDFETAEGVGSVAVPGGEPLHGGFHAVNYPVDPSITAAVFVPDYELSTEKARQALPRELPYKDAVYNVSRVGLLPAAMNPVVLAQAAQQGKSGVAAAPAQDADTCACSGGTRESAFADELAAAQAQSNALLFTATQDKLHQPYRGALMPPSTELIALFRSKGYAAAVSGAGPCVLVLHYGNAREAIDQIASEQLASGHWRVLHLPINTAGVEIERR